VIEAHDRAGIGDSSASGQKDAVVLATDQRSGAVVGDDPAADIDAIMAIGDDRP
jgi:hypothetical protein